MASNQEELAFQSARNTLLAYYSSKITSQIGYIISVTVGFIGLIQTYPDLLFYFIISWVFGGFYFFCRIIFWSMHTNFITVVKPYSKKELDDRKDGVLTSEGFRYEYNPLWALQSATIDGVKRTGIYKGNTKKKFARLGIWASGFMFKIIIILGGIIILGIYDYFFGKNILFSFLKSLPWG